MSKRILIVSYYFPPNKGTASPRPYSWAKHFTNVGHKVTVVTRFWDGNDNTWEDYTGSTSTEEPIIKMMDGFETVYLPYLKYIYPRNPVIRKLVTFFALLNGKLEREVDTMQFVPYIEERISSEKFDLIITTAPPWNMVKLAYHFSEKFNIPSIVDFRDYELDMVLNKNPKPTVGRKIEFLIDRFFITKWLKETEFIVSASKPMGDYLTRFTQKENIEVLNGYDSELLASCSQEPDKEQFKISVLGYIYPPQQLEILFEGFKLFLEIEPNPELIFQFIGLEAIPLVTERIKNNMPEKFVLTTKRLSMEESLSIGHQSHVLFYPGWKDWVGMYSAKIATYIGLHKNLLIAPGDQDVLDEIINTTKAGYTANTSQEFCDKLMAWYTEWKETGDLKFHGDVSKSEFYSREYQAKYFLDEIQNRVFSTGNPER